MQKLTAGITKAGTGIDDIVWNIFGQIYAPKAVSDSSFSWHATFPPGTFVPPHIHPTQDEFIYMFEGRLDLVIDGRDVVAGRSGPHADGPAARYFQQVGSASEMFFLGVTDAQALRLVLGDPFDEGTETRGRRPASGQARSEFSAAAEVTKIAALPYSRSSLTVSATNLPSAESSQRTSRGMTMKLPRRKFLHLAAVAVSLPTASRYVWAQAYPTRPVRIIVGFPGGVAPDIVARVTGQALSERLGRQFVIENRPGAGSNIGTEIVVRAPPDGYTLLLAVSSSAINATLYSNLTFNFIRDIAPVAMIGLTPFVMVLNPKVPTKTVPEFIAYPKANPGKINMASQGNGLASHLMGELFKMMAGVILVHVPYSGGYAADLLGGQVQVAFSPIPTVIEYIRDARLRSLAVTTATRVEFLPDVPAMSEFLPGYDATGWNGIGAPKGTTSAIIEKLNKEINAIVLDPAMKTRLNSLGVEPLSMTPAELGKRIVDDTEKWAKLIKFANITAE